MLWAKPYYVYIGVLTQIASSVSQVFFKRAMISQVVVIGAVGRLNIGVLKMEEEDEWSPETKLWPFVAPLCTQITPN